MWFLKAFNTLTIRGLILQVFLCFRMEKSYLTMYVCLACFQKIDFTSCVWHVWFSYVVFNTFLVLSNGEASFSRSFTFGNGERSSLIDKRSLLVSGLFTPPHPAPTPTPPNPSHPHPPLSLQLSGQCSTIYYQGIFSQCIKQEADTWRNPGSLSRV